MASSRQMPVAWPFRWLFLLAFRGAWGSDYNIVNLDNASFPLVVGQSFPVLVRFDREYPYGEKAEAFKAMAKVLAKAESQVLVASIGVSTFGEKQNQDMARKFNFIPKEKEELQSEDMEKIFPKFMYFKPGDSDGQLYNGAATKAGFLKFLDVVEKTCDVLTGAFCSTEEKQHAEYFQGKSLQELQADLATFAKKSKETPKKGERQLVDGRLKILKKLIKAMKKGGKETQKQL